MTESVVSLKRQRSPSNTTEEPEEKYSYQNQQFLMNPAALGAMFPVPVSSARGGVAPAGFPLLQYCQMIQQMQQQQQIEVPTRKESKEESTASGPSSRRQTMSSSSMTPRPIRVPTQQFLNPLQFLPQSLGGSQPAEIVVQSPSPARPQSPLHTYHTPSFQRADEEVYSKFVDSVRKLAAKLAAEKSS